MDKVWCRIQLFITRDNNMTGIGGPCMMMTRIGRLGRIRTRTRRPSMVDNWKIWFCCKIYKIFYKEEGKSKIAVGE
jgi:hypothetical protein